MGYQIYKHFSNRSPLQIIGDVRTVLNGLVDESKMHEDVLNQLTFALGAGSFSGCACTGETLIFNQMGYSCYVNKTAELVTEKANTGLKSPFLMGLGLDCLPSNLLSLDYPEGISLDELFKQLGSGLPAYAFVAKLKFNTLACSYIQKAPIFKENINENVDQYWAKTEELKNCQVYAFGVVIKESGLQFFSTDLLQKAFYINPQEKNKGGLLSHTHAVLVTELSPEPTKSLDEDFQNFTRLDPNAVLGVRHIFTQSVLKSGFMGIFNIDGIKGSLEPSF